MKMIFLQYLKIGKRIKFFICHKITELPVRLFSGVSSQVILQISIRPEAFFAEIAFERKVT
jgi:hypothetical protein